MFLYFLEVLKYPGKALIVAVHFQRVAADEATPSTTKFFLMGRTSDVSSDDLEEPNVLIMTTALHEAVKASNYPLVEYLVKTRFKLSALDNHGKTALDIATSKDQSSSANNSIIALLRQDMAYRNKSRGRRNGGILGWENLSLVGEPLINAWRETSVDGGFDAITFIAPKTGLYESDRLTLGRIQGQNQIYRLDPFRFLKAPWVISWKMNLPPKRSTATNGMKGMPV